MMDMANLVASRWCRSALATYMSRRAAGRKWAMCMPDTASSAFMTNSQPKARRTADSRQASRTIELYVKVAYVAVEKLCRSSRSSMSKAKGLPGLGPGEARALPSGAQGMEAGVSTVGELTERGVRGAPPGAEVV
jgi:hypothetical protein